MTLVATSSAALPLQILFVHGHLCLFSKAYFCGMACWVLGTNEKLEVGLAIIITVPPLATVTSLKSPLTQCFLKR